MIARAVALLFVVLFGSDGTGSQRARLIALARRALDGKYWGPAYSVSRKLIALAPDDAIGWLLLGLAQRGDGHPADARESFARADHLAPGNDVILFNLATASMESGRFDEAEVAFVKVAALDDELAPLAYLNAGFAAASAGRLEAAVHHLRAARRMARGDPTVTARAKDLEQRIAEARGEEAQAGIRRLVRETRQALLAGHAEAARARLREAIGLARGNAVELLPDLKELAAAVDQHARAAAERVSVEIGLGAGWDSLVPQSLVVITEPTKAQNASPSAFYLSADLALAVRAVGETSNGLTLRYNFSQTAYLSQTLDEFSTMEHDLGLVGRVSPTDWLRLELDVSGFFVALGVLDPSLFKAGGEVAPVIVLREGASLETRLGYRHVFTHAFGGESFLSGDEDSASASQSWRNDRARFQVGYRFTRNAVGAQDVPVADIFGNDIPAFGDGAIYHIPYSYLSHEASASATLHLPWSLTLSTTVRYEHRDYGDPSYVSNPTDKTKPKQMYPLQRVDDRLIVEATASRPLGSGFAVEIAYTYVGSFSNIDFTDPRTPLAYDDKNYDKHVVELGLTWSY